MSKDFEMLDKKLHAVLEIDLVYPYKKSLEILFLFCNEWNCLMIKSGTSRSKATIAMDIDKFKKIWGKKPKKGSWGVPAGAEDFMLEVNVLHVKEI